MRKIKEKIFLVSLWRNSLNEILHARGNIKKIGIKKIKKVNLGDREVYFLEANYKKEIKKISTTDRWVVEEKYILIKKKNLWSLIHVDKMDGDQRMWENKKEKIMISHLFPKEVGDLNNLDEAKLLACFIEIKEIFEGLISKYGK